MKVRKNPREVMSKFSQAVQIGDCMWDRISAADLPKKLKRSSKQLSIWDYYKLNKTKLCLKDESWVQMKKGRQENIYWWVKQWRFKKVFRSNLLMTLKLLTELYFKHSEVRMAAKEFMGFQRWCRY